MTEPVWEFPMRLPRHAFSPRDAARAGDVWRCFQEAAVEASSRAGWTPARYREAATAFVVRAMTVVHHREATYGEETRARTWVHDFKRRVISLREIRLGSDEGPVASTTQQWVHVRVEGAELKLSGAPPELVQSFPPHEEDGPVSLPDYEPLPGATTRFRLTCWHTWMDPLDHVNHPAYVDWCDEAIARVVAGRGISPVAIVPVAEELTFREGATAMDEVVVECTRLGRTAEGDLVLGHRITRADGTPCADGRTVRRMVGGDSAALVSAFDPE